MVHHMQVWGLRSPTGTTLYPGIAPRPTHPLPLPLQMMLNAAHPHHNPFLLGPAGNALDPLNLHFHAALNMAVRREGERVCLA